MNLGMIGAGLVMGISTIGSGVGIWVAGQSVVGAWKRCYVANKPAPMLLLVFAAMPLSQTFYGFILMNQMLTAVPLHPEKGLLYMALGVAAALSNLFTAYAQGQISASAADAQGETGKGFAQYISVIGISESVSLFAMVFSMIAL
ncbi:MAG: V-type ATP synthase subunit K [Treponema sp.]|jgi:V/A-type H+-transporting ATPase subunit K|nr:V-type ATP synthase subunit K [Treponema sp.]